MRKLFSNIYNSIGGNDEKTGSASGILDSSNRRLAKSRSKSGIGFLPDNAIQLVESAATVLADSIQNILSNIANLSSDNLSGYHQLLETLDDQYRSQSLESDNQKLNPKDSSNITTLLQHMDHPSFVELCFQANLATGLYQALRLLRMLEIIQAKSSADVSSTTNEETKGITFTASSNVCKILEKLCSSPVTIEQLRQSLVKLLVFPLNSLPYCGRHIQIHSSWIVFAIAKTGFTSQQVWFLHDSHYINYALRSISELIDYHNQKYTKEELQSSPPRPQQPPPPPQPSQSQQPKDVLLRGASAEKEGMWSEALKCVIEVINSSLTVSSALLNDLEAMNGSNIFIHMLCNCSPDRFLRNLNLISAFIFRCSKKDDDTMVFNSITSLLSDFIRSSLHIDKGVLISNKIETMIELGHHVLDKNLVVPEKEYIIQGLSYAILTMYSNDPVNCTALEEKYNLLPFLIICLPATSLPETISAVLTTFNYICQCVESNNTILFSSISASVSIMISIAMHQEYSMTKRNLSIQFMELCFTSLEAISKTNSKYANIFMKNGFVKNVVCDAFERLNVDLREGYIMDDSAMIVFDRILVLITELISRSPNVPEDIRKSGLNPILRAIVSIPTISTSFTNNILLLFEELSKTDESYMEESIVNILRLISSDSLSSERITCLFNSLWKILLFSGGRAAKFLKEGAETALSSLLSLHDLLPPDPNDQVSVSPIRRLKSTQNADSPRFASSPTEILDCIESILRFFSLYIFYSNENLRDPLFLSKISYSLVKSNIFQTAEYASYGLSFLFEFITLFTKEKTFIDPLNSEILVVIISYFSKASLRNFLVCLVNYFQSNFQKVYLLYENEIVSRFCSRLFEEIKGNKELEDLLFQFISIILKRYRSQELTFISFKLVMRPIGCNLLDSIDWVNGFVNNIVSSSTIMNDFGASPMNASFFITFPSQCTLIPATVQFNKGCLETLFPEILLASSSSSPVSSNSSFFGQSPSINMPIPILSSTEESFSLGSFALLFNETTALIPANNLSISCWFKFNSDILGSPYFNKFSLFSLESVTDRVIIMVELFLHNSEILVKFFNVETMKEEVLCFKISSSLWSSNGIRWNDWTNLILTLKRNKRFTHSNQVVANVFFNGLLLPTVPISSSAALNSPHSSFSPTATSTSQKTGNGNIIEFDCLTVPQNGELRFGFSKQAWVPGEINNLNNSTTGKLSFGTFALFTEGLTAKHCILLFLKGPGYSGQYSTETELTEHLISFSTQLLKIANYLTKKSVTYVEKTGMKGVEFVVEPKHEQHDQNITEFDLTNLPEPFVVISPSFVVEDPRQLTLSESENGTSREGSSSVKLNAVAQPRRFNIQNILDLENETSFIGILTSPGTVASPLSIGTCITGLGSLDALMPLIFLSPDDDTLTSILSLMQQVIKENVTSLKRSQAYTYRVLAFIMHLLPAKYLSTKILQKLIQFGVESTPNTQRLSSFGEELPLSPSLSFNIIQESVLLIDPLAVAHFICNHHVWNRNNFSNFSFLLRQLRMMVVDDKNKVINLMRLSTLGFIRWIIFACLNTVMESSSQIMYPEKSELINEDNLNANSKVESRDVWVYQPRTSFEMADYRDEPEGFLKDANNIIRYLISSELRHKDIELITNTIQFTFNIEESHYEQPVDRDVLEKLKQKNYEELSQVHPFCTYEMDSSNVSNSNPETDTAQMHRDEAHTAVDDDDNEGSTAFYRFHFLNAFEFYRIYLLRLLTSLYDDTIEEIRKTKGPNNNNAVNSANEANADSFEIYREKCSPEWFLSILERSDEIATRSQILRLLSHFLEKDLKFSREFIDCKGFQVIYSLLSPVTQPIPILLPIFAMLFKIPMQMLMYPFQVKSVSKFSQVLELEECSRDLLFSTDSFWVMNYSLPLLSIFYECLIKILRRTERQEDTDRDSFEIKFPASCSSPSLGRRNGYVHWGTKAEELMIGILESGILHSAPFRRLMQNKLAIEIHVNALLSCTNAFSDYGTVIYGAKRESADLTKAIDEEYVSPTTRPQVSTPNDSRDRGFSSDYFTHVDGDNGNEDITSLPLQVLNSAGLSLQRMIHYLIRHAIREEDNPRILYSLFTSSTTLLSSLSFERSYQLLVVNVFTEIAKESQGLDNQIIAAIVRNITYLIPLVRGLYFYDAAVFELLKICVSLIETITCMYETSELTEQLPVILRDLISNSRYLAFVLMSMVLGIHHTATYKSGSVNRLQLLSYLRNKLEFFFHNFSDDSIEPIISTAGARYPSKSVSVVEDGLSFGAPAMFEALQGFTSGGSQRKTITHSQNMNGNSGSSSQITQIRSERNRVTSIFCSYLACVAYNLVLDEDSQVRTEATRMIAFLSQRKGILMDQLVGNSSTFVLKICEMDNLGVDIFREGLSKLVPNSEGKYQLYLRGGTDDNESEDNRFADFSFWISDNNTKCDLVFRTIDNAVLNVLPNLQWESDELVRKLKYKASAKDLFAAETADNIKASLKRKQNGQEIGQKIGRLLSHWRSEGIKELTTGAMLWKKSWISLKSSLLWGYGRITKQGNNYYAHHFRQLHRGLLEPADITEKSLIDAQNVDFYGKIIWKVDYCEGPERCRKKLLQDLSAYSPVLFGEASSTRSASGVASPVPSGATTQAEGESIVSQSGKFSPDANDNIDDILLTMKKRGILRGMSSQEQQQQQQGFDDVTLSSSDYSSNDLPLETSMNDGLQMSSRQSDATSKGSKFYEMEEEADTEKIIEADDELQQLQEENVIDFEDEELPLNIAAVTQSSTASLNNNNPVSNSGGRPPRGSQIFTSVKPTRAMMIKEIVKGIVSSNELKRCQVHNIERFAILSSIFCANR
jgi:hypothetical protein